MGNLKSSLIKISIHLILAFSLVAVLIIGLFYIYLPAHTGKDIITVPNVIGSTIDEMNEELTARSFRYEVNLDSGYSSKYQPFDIIQQFPVPGSKVKVGRKIYLTLNRASPPLVDLPDLKYRSIENAQKVLNSYELTLGEVTYVPVFGGVFVLEMSFDGDTKYPGDQVPKGGIIDIVVSDGKGNDIFDCPMLIGLNKELAEVAIKGSGLLVGELYIEKSDSAVAKALKKLPESLTIPSIDPGEVYQQYPRPGEKSSYRDLVDIWVYLPDTTTGVSTILNAN